MSAAGAWRRILAFGLDYLVILGYAGLLLAVGMTALSGLRQANLAPWQAQLLGFISLTLPVLLYFALGESLAGATLGKRLTRLRVTNSSGKRLGLLPSLVRSGAKFLPWEIAHTAVHRVVQPDAAPGWPYLFYISLGLAGLYLWGLLRPLHRPLYDRLAGASVRRLPSSLLEEVPS